MDMAPNAHARWIASQSRVGRAFGFFDGF